MRLFSLAALAPVVLLVACAHAPQAKPERFHFDIKFLGGGLACSVEATEIATGNPLFVQAALPRNRRDTDASYEDGNSGLMLVVKLVHDDDNKFHCTGTVTERGQLVASESRDQ